VGGPRLSAEEGGEGEKSRPRGEGGPGRLLGRAEGKEERRKERPWAGLCGREERNGWAGPQGKKKEKTKKWAGLN
jgi:hypothetical protein